MHTCTYKHTNVQTFFVHIHNHVGYHPQGTRTRLILWISRDFPFQVICSPLDWNRKSLSKDPFWTGETKGGPFWVEICSEMFWFEVIMDASGVQNGMPTCTIGHRLCLEWGWLCLDLCTRMDWNRALSCLVMWSSYDHVWWCVMLCDVPFKSKDSSLDLWRLRWRWCAAWKTATCHPAPWPVASMPQIQILSGSEKWVGESKVTWKKISIQNLTHITHWHTSTKMESLSLHHSEITKYERSKGKNKSEQHLCKTRNVKKTTQMLSWLKQEACQFTQLK